ncbi:MAG: HAD hydrolase family protein [Candidatus Sungiibacteriota bacterium]|uniref:HAD hydrolase family protein n=1 Tax=Candidatus Sungiibacteriota bacterium TaxID=2750080 RepID=A0A7T5RJX2_9BACT|nr:MAG: HAD hydrolase family protein [Candidatus Sungbacteria bacterium]
MNYKYPEDILARARNIKAVALDSDGVIFTGHVIEGKEGPLAKTRCHADGQGVSLLRAAGIPIVCVTGEHGQHAAFLERLVEKWNGLPSVASGKWLPIKIFSGVERLQKVAVVESWLASHRLNLGDCAALGDDLTDYDLLRHVGLAAAPAQAEDVVKKVVHFVTPRRGGHGAIRDLANFILDAKGVDVTSLLLR